MLRISGFIALSVSLIVASVLPLATAHAQARDISAWNQTAATHPAGTVYTEGDAVLARYPMSALDAANNGGLANVPKGDATARMEWALSIIEMGMSEFDMTTLSGMPAAVGTAQTYNGEVSFAAGFTGRAGSKREMLNIFYAPVATFEALGGMEMLAENRPSVSVNYAATPAKIATERRQESAPKPARARKRLTRSEGTRGVSRSAADLLAGVKGDLKKMEDEAAKERAVAKAKADTRKAAALKSKRERLYRASGARKGHYPAPTADNEFLVWPQQDSWLVQVPGDSASPRVATRVYSATVVKPAAALKAFIAETGMTMHGSARFELLDAYKSLDGREVQIMLTETRLQGQTGIAFVFYARGKTNPDASLRVIEMPASTYEAWGGVAGMLKMRGVIPDVSVFPASERRRIARSPLKEQTALYEAVLDKFYMENALALMLTQAQTTAMMTELNYDLLFGNDITPGPWAN